jgi:uncharacterized protein (DUF736 family)
LFDFFVFTPILITMSETKTENKWNEREIGALWTKESRSGSQKYMTGHFKNSQGEKTDVVVFSNKDKKNEKAPDFRVYISEKTKPSSEVSRQPTPSSNDGDIL